MCVCKGTAEKQLSLWGLYMTAALPRALQLGAVVRFQVLAVSWYRHALHAVPASSFTTGLQAALASHDPSFSTQRSSKVRTYLVSG